MSDRNAIAQMLIQRNWYIEPLSRKEITFRSHQPVLLYNGGQRDDYITIDLAKILYMRKGNNHLWIDLNKERVYRFTGEVNDVGYYQTVYSHTLDDFYNALDTLAGPHDSTKEPYRQRHDAAWWGKMLKEGTILG